MSIARDIELYNLHMSSARARRGFSSRILSIISRNGRRTVPLGLPLGLPHSPGLYGNCYSLLITEAVAADSE
jgi:hypothetical protein